MRVAVLVALVGCVGGRGHDDAPNFAFVTSTKLAASGSHPADGTADAETVPLRVGGRELGRLQVAARSPGEPYTDGDRRLLAALAPQVAVVVRALELAEALEAERDQVVAVTRQERQRLRRDLHDGLGPSLSGVSLGLQALQDARVADGAKAYEY